MRSDRLAVENVHGVLVPRTLGIWLVIASIVSAVVVELGRPRGAVSRAGWGVFVASLLVFSAGLVDDLAPAGPRGVRDHLQAFVSGHVTTGIVKLVVVVAAAIVSIALQDKGNGVDRVAGVVLVAGCANLWNGLDVCPGRALKVGLVAMIAVANVPIRLLPTLPGVAVASVLALWPDLRERAMLGDSGANLLGFTIGSGLYVVLPGWGVAVAGIVALALNVVADTVTLSRVVEAVPPLRWFDGLGRPPE
ncbi:MAG: hypothetical protein ABI869_05560 [Actinomycetota bacterium]